MHSSLAPKVWGCLGLLQYVVESEMANNPKVAPPEHCDTLGRPKIGIPQKRCVLLQNLERSSQPVTPFGFLMQLREKYPQFAQQRNGFYMQQDAEECWTQLLYSLGERLKVGCLLHKCLALWLGEFAQRKQLPYSAIGHPGHA